MRRRYSHRTHGQKNENGSFLKIFITILILALVVGLKMGWIPINLQESDIPVSNPVNSSGEDNNKSAPVGGILRANVAKLIAYTHYDLDEIQQLSREIEIEDTLPSFWYDKYINAVIQLGYMQSKNNKFYPTEFITYEEVINILNEISEDKYSVEIKSEQEVKNKKISMHKFMNLYKEVLKKLSPNENIKEHYGIYEKNIIVLATASNDESLGAWKVATDQGEYGFEGIALDGYLDKKIKVLVKNNEILGVLDIADNNPPLESAIISKVENGQVEVMIGGVTKLYNTDILDETYNNSLVDLYFENGKIIKVDLKKEQYKDRVIRIKDEYIEMEKNGAISFAEELKIYDQSEEGAKWSSLSNVIVGSPDVEYAMENGKINTITIKNKSIINKIRVLITTTDFQDKLHKEVEITSEEPFSVDFYGDKKTYEANEVLKISEWNKKMTFEKPRIKITPSNGAKLKIQSINRQSKEPLYSGVLEVCKEENGQYSLINEVSIEDYVAGVIPSEMPTSYGLEACKVQAVTARSYAYIQANNNKYRDYGANIDDSTNSQVYNNIQADDISLKAAEETKGKVLQYNGQVISANCFATSSGYTANFGEVWANTDGTFPANTPVYLVSKKQYESKEVVDDMTNEENAYKFFTSSGVSLDAFDSQSPWFRWKLTMSGEEITNSVNAGIARRYKASPHLIKTLGSDRIFRSKEIDSIGTVEKIQIHKRGQGGNIMELIIYGSKDTIKVSTEYNIRTLFSPMQRIEGKEPIVIKRQDATEVKNFEMLPSAFFAIDAKYDKNEKLQSVTFYGGGFGHGVGMSQDGVRGMVQKGYNYQQILSHYYPETKVGSI